VWPNRSIGEAHLLCSTVSEAVGGVAAEAIDGPGTELARSANLMVHMQWSAIPRRRHSVPDINAIIADLVEERENVDLDIISLKLTGASSSQKLENLLQRRSELERKIIEAE